MEVGGDAMRLIVILSFLLAGPLLAQYGYPQYPQYPRARSETRKTAPGAAEQPMPAFSGKVLEIDKKKLTLESESPNPMEFNRTRKTEYFDGKDTIKAGVIKAGDTVTVETRKAPDGTLDAVIVRLEKKPVKRDQ